MAIHFWNKHKVEVLAHALAKYLWGVIIITVKVDDKYIFNSSNPVRIKETLNFEINHENEVYECKLVSLPPSSLILFRYKIIINDNEVAIGKSVTDNWYMLYGLLALCIAGVFIYVSIT